MVTRGNALENHEPYHIYHHIKVILENIVHRFKKTLKRLQLTHYSNEAYDFECNVPYAPCTFQKTLKNNNLNDREKYHK